MNDKQKEELKKLKRFAALSGAKAGVKYAALIVLSTVTVVLINEHYVHSDPFLLVASLLNGICCAKLLSDDMEAARKTIKERIEQIYKQ